MKTEAEKIAEIMQDQGIKVINEPIKFKNKKPFEKKEVITEEPIVSNKIKPRMNKTRENFKAGDTQTGLFDKHYRTELGHRLHTYSVDFDKDHPTIKSVKKNIHITDRGSEIISNLGKKNMQEKVKIMLAIAHAKKWDISDIDITGEESFKVETSKQIEAFLQNQEVQKPVEKVIEKNSLSLKKMQNNQKTSDEIKVKNEAVKSQDKQKHGRGR